MPNFGLWYASGPKEMREAQASSAFSAGDLLCFDSNSSLSRMPDGLGADIVGIATSSSTASANLKVPYIVPEADTVFWSDVTTGSQFTAGERATLAYVGARWFLTSSNTSQYLSVERGTADIPQSVQSRALVKFIRVSGTRMASG